MSHQTDHGERTYHVMGVPLRTGSLYPGSENDADAYRHVKLLEQLHAAGCRARDEGDISIPSYLPHHAVPPIRSWPGPRIVWDCLSRQLKPHLHERGHIPLLVGCDCSVVVGTTQALMSSAARDVRILYVDGDFDDAAPDPERCQSAAAMAVWLLTHRSPFWTGPPLRPSDVTVIGWSTPSQSEQPGLNAHSLAEVRRRGARVVAQQALDAIPASANIVVHFDLDVLRAQEMPAAYFPHEDGLTLSEGEELFGALAKDPRIRIIEVSEYASLRDADHSSVGKVATLLVGGLKPTG